MVTTLFFMWGFLTCLNDILIPHLKAIFDLDYAQVMLVQFAFFGAYAVFSIPAGFITERVGYKPMMVAGLLTMAVGALLFIPAAIVPSFPLFLAALIILAAGITVLQVAANPYVALLGPAKTASSRLTLTQAFNSFGTFIAPPIGGILILATAPKTAAQIAAMLPDGIAGLPHRAGVVGEDAIYRHRRRADPAGRLSSGASSCRISPRPRAATRS